MSLQNATVAQFEQLLAEFKDHSRDITVNGCVNAETIASLKEIYANMHTFPRSFTLSLCEALFEVSCAVFSCSELFAGDFFSQKNSVRFVRLCVRIFTVTPVECIGHNLPKLIVSFSSLLDVVTRKNYMLITDFIATICSYTRFGFGIFEPFLSVTYKHIVSLPFSSSDNFIEFNIGHPFFISLLERNKFYDEPHFDIYRRVHSDASILSNTCSNNNDDDDDDEMCLGRHDFYCLSGLLNCLTNMIGHYKILAMNQIVKIFITVNSLPVFFPVVPRLHQAYANFLGSLFELFLYFHVKSRDSEFTEKFPLYKEVQFSRTCYTIFFSISLLKDIDYKKKSRLAFFLPDVFIFDPDNLGLSSLKTLFKTSFIEHQCGDLFYHAFAYFPGILTHFIRLLSNSDTAEYFNYINVAMNCLMYCNSIQTILQYNNFHNMCRITLYSVVSFNRTIKVNKGNSMQDLSDEDKTLFSGMILFFVRLCFNGNVHLRQYSTCLDGNKSGSNAVEACVLEIFKTHFDHFSLVYKIIYHHSLCSFSSADTDSYLRQLFLTNSLFAYEIPNDLFLVKKLLKVLLKPFVSVNFETVRQRKNFFINTEYYKRFNLTFVIDHFVTYYNLVNIITWVVNKVFVKEFDEIRVFSGLYVLMLLLHVPKLHTHVCYCLFDALLPMDEQLQTRLYTMIKHSEDMKFQLKQLFFGLFFTCSSMVKDEKCCKISVSFLKNLKNLLIKSCFSGRLLKIWLLIADSVVLFSAQNFTFAPAFFVVDFYVDFFLAVYKIFCTSHFVYVDYVNIHHHQQKPQQSQSQSQTQTKKGIRVAVCKLLLKLYTCLSSFNQNVGAFSALLNVTIYLLNNKYTKLSQNALNMAEMHIETFFVNKNEKTSKYLRLFIQLFNSLLSQLKASKIQNTDREYVNTMFRMIGLLGSVSSRITENTDVDFMDISSLVSTSCEYLNNSIYPSMDKVLASCTFKPVSFCPCKRNNCSFSCEFDTNNKSVDEKLIYLIYCRTFFVAESFDFYVFNFNIENCNTDTCCKILHNAIVVCGEEVLPEKFQLLYKIIVRQLIYSQKANISPFVNLIQLVLYKELRFDLISAVLQFYYNKETVDRTIIFVHALMNECNLNEKLAVNTFIASSCVNSTQINTQDSCTLMDSNNSFVMFVIDLVSRLDDNSFFYLVKRARTSCLKQFSRSLFVCNSHYYFLGGQQSSFDCVISTVVEKLLEYCMLSQNTVLQQKIASCFIRQIFINIESCFSLLLNIKNKNLWYMLFDCDTLLGLLSRTFNSSLNNRQLAYLSFIIFFTNQSVFSLCHLQQFYTTLFSLMIQLNSINHAFKIIKFLLIFLSDQIYSLSKELYVDALNLLKTNIASIFEGNNNNSNVLFFVQFLKGAKRLNKYYSKYGFIVSFSNFQADLEIDFFRVILHISQKESKFLFCETFYNAMNALAFINTLSGDEDKRREQTDALLKNVFYGLKQFITRSIYFYSSKNTNTVMLVGKLLAKYEDMEQMSNSFGSAVNMSDEEKIRMQAYFRNVIDESSEFEYLVKIMAFLFEENIKSISAGSSYVSKIDSIKAFVNVYCEVYHLCNLLCVHYDMHNNGRFMLVLSGTLLKLLQIVYGLFDVSLVKTTNSLFYRVFYGDEDFSDDQITTNDGNLTTLMSRMFYSIYNSFAMYPKEKSAKSLQLSFMAITTEKFDPNFNGLYVKTGSELLFLKMLKKDALLCSFIFEHCLTLLVNACCAIDKYGFSSNLKTNPFFKNTNALITFQYLVKNLLNTNCGNQIKDCSQLLAVVESLVALMKDEFSCSNKFSTSCVSSGTLKQLQVMATVCIDILCFLIDQPDSVHFFGCVLCTSYCLFKDIDMEKNFFPLIEKIFDRHPQTFVNYLINYFCAILNNSDRISVRTEAHHFLDALRFCLRIVKNKKGTSNKNKDKDRIENQLQVLLGYLLNNEYYNCLTVNSCVKYLAVLSLEVFEQVTCIAANFLLKYLTLFTEQTQLSAIALAKLLANKSIIENVEFKMTNYGYLKNILIDNKMLAQLFVDYEEEFDDECLKITYDKQGILDDILSNLFNLSNDMFVERLLEEFTTKMVLLSEITPTLASHSSIINARRVNNFDWLHRNNHLFDRKLEHSKKIVFACYKLIYSKIYNARQQNLVVFLNTLVHHYFSGVYESEMATDSGDFFTCKLLSKIFLLDLNINPVFEYILENFTDKQLFLFYHAIIVREFENFLAKNNFYYVICIVFRVDVSLVDFYMAAEQMDIFYSHISHCTKFFDAALSQIGGLFKLNTVIDLLLKLYDYDSEKYKSFYGREKNSFVLNLPCLDNYSNNPRLCCEATRFLFSIENVALFEQIIKMLLKSKTCCKFDAAKLFDCYANCLTKTSEAPNFDTLVNIIRVTSNSDCGELKKSVIDYFLSHVRFDETSKSMVKFCLFVLSVQFSGKSLVGREFFNTNFSIIFDLKFIEYFFVNTNYHLIDNICNPLIVCCLFLLNFFGIKPTFEYYLILLKDLESTKVTTIKLINRLYQENYPLFKETTKFNKSFHLKKAIASFMYLYYDKIDINKFMYKTLLNYSLTCTCDEEFFEIFKRLYTTQGANLFNDGKYIKKLTRIFSGSRHCIDRKVTVIGMYLSTFFSDYRDCFRFLDYMVYNEYEYAAADINSFLCDKPLLNELLFSTSKKEAHFNALQDMMVSVYTDCCNYLGQWDVLTELLVQQDDDILTQTPALFSQSINTGDLSLLGFLLENNKKQTNKNFLLPNYKTQFYELVNINYKNNNFINLNEKKSIYDQFLFVLDTFQREYSSDTVRFQTKRQFLRTVSIINETGSFINHNKLLLFNGAESSNVNNEKTVTNFLINKMKSMAKIWNIKPHLPIDGSSYLYELLNLRCLHLKKMADVFNEADVENNATNNNNNINLTGGDEFAPLSFAFAFEKSRPNNFLIMNILRSLQITCLQYVNVTRKMNLTATAITTLNAMQSLLSDNSTVYSGFFIQRALQLVKCYTRMYDAVHDSCSKFGNSVENALLQESLCYLEDMLKGQLTASQRSSSYLLKARIFERQQRFNDSIKCYEESISICNSFDNWASYCHLLNQFYDDILEISMHVPSNTNNNNNTNNSNSANNAPTHAMEESVYIAGDLLYTSMSSVHFAKDCHQAKIISKSIEVLFRHLIDKNFLINNNMNTISTNNNMVYVHAYLMGIFEQFLPKVHLTIWYFWQTQLIILWQLNNCVYNWNGIFNLLNKLALNSPLLILEQHPIKSNKHSRVGFKNTAVFKLVFNLAPILAHKHAEYCAHISQYFVDKESEYEIFELSKNSKTNTNKNYRVSFEKRREYCIKMPNEHYHNSVYNRNYSVFFQSSDQPFSMVPRAAKSEMMSLDGYLESNDGTNNTANGNAAAAGNINANEAANNNNDVMNVYRTVLRITREYDHQDNQCYLIVLDSTGQKNKIKVRVRDTDIKETKISMYSKMQSWLNYFLMCTPVSVSRDLVMDHKSQAYSLEGDFVYEKVSSYKRVRGVEQIVLGEFTNDKQKYYSVLELSRQQASTVSKSVLTRQMSENNYELCNFGEIQNTTTLRYLKKVDILKRHKFTKDLAVQNCLQYVLGLPEFNLRNMEVCLNSGGLRCSYKMSVKHLENNNNNKHNKRMLFRLTRNFYSYINAVEVRGLYRNSFLSCAKTMAIQKNCCESVLFALMATIAIQNRTNDVNCSPAIDRYVKNVFEDRLGPLSDTVEGRKTLEQVFVEIENVNHLYEQVASGELEESDEDMRYFGFF